MHIVSRLLFVSSLMLSATSCSLNAEQSSLPYSRAGTFQDNEELRGWGTLLRELEEEGISRRQAERIFLSSAVPKFTTVDFKVRKGESKRLYREFQSATKVELAMSHLKKHKRSYQHAWRSFKVDPSVIASILLIETHYGRNTGNSRILYRLARLANIHSPSNIDYNYRRLHKKDPSISLSEVKSRAHTIARMFVPEVATLIRIADRKGFNPLNIKGSHAGAFGIPQFLPTSFDRYGVDGNNDGSISLYQMEDAILSTANFLSRNGWKPDLTRQEQEGVVWHYNHSKAYVDAVLGLASKIKG